MNILWQVASDKFLPFIDQFSLLIRLVLHQMGRSPCCGATGLKRGPWTPEEDQKLLAYIQKHGHGSWRTLPDKAGQIPHRSSKFYD